MLSRRRFLGLGGAAGVGLTGLGAAARQGGTPVQDPQIRNHVTLGKTGLVVSDIGFGSASSTDADLVRHALDRGVTFFDTAESYRFGRAEKAFGEGLQGVRDQVIIASKTKARTRHRQADMMEALEGSLRRLRTDYVDIYFNHAVNDVSRMQNEEWWAFTERAKQQGKIRFRGVSGHGSQLVPCLDYTIDNDLADVILVAYSFAQDPDFYDKMRHVFHYVDMQPDLPRVLDKAKEKDIGVIAMKTLMGARLNDMRQFERDGSTFAQAAFRWVLSSPRVDSVLISMTSTELIDEYVGGSGNPDMRGGDLNLLARYAYLQGARYCRHGCDFCAGACPDAVPIAEVLRTRMYAVDYGDTAMAVADYAALGDGAARCLSCSHQACLGACPYRLPIPELTCDAATRLV